MSQHPQQFHPYQPQQPYYGATQQGYMARFVKRQSSINGVIFRLQWVVSLMQPTIGAHVDGTPQG